MKRIGLFVIVFFCISLLLHASGPRVLFIGDSITDGNWGNACGMPKPTAERSLWDMNHIYGSGYMYLCASHYQPLILLAAVNSLSEVSLVAP